MKNRKKTNSELEIMLEFLEESKDDIKQFLFVGMNGYELIGASVNCSSTQFRTILGLLAATNSGMKDDIICVADQFKDPEYNKIVEEAKQGKEYKPKTKKRNNEQRQY